MKRTKIRSLVVKPSLAALVVAWMIVATTGQGTSTDKPAEQVYTNIQVFKGLPSSQLMPAMFFMRGSLGVTCTNCHVNFRDFEKDDNPNKRAARKMILMTRDLNKNSFGGGLAVTCNTCHRGRPKPTAALAFAAITNKKDDKKEETNGATGSTTVDKVFDQYMAATGGKAAHEKFADRVLQGAMLSSEGANAPLKIITKAPDKVLVTFDISWISYRASNGVTGWSQDNRGLHNVVGGNLAGLKREGALFQPTQLKGLYQDLKLIGKDLFDGREAYVIEGTLGEAGTEQLYFDVGTGLLVRITSISVTPLGAIPREIDLEDYREVNGVKIPFLVIRQAPDFTSAYKIASVGRDMPGGLNFDKPMAPLPSLMK
jgi:Photosynthetic reaction centre cytochrome C subunit